MVICLLALKDGTVILNPSQVYVHVSVMVCS
jgi:hypothetical protein